MSRANALFFLCLLSLWPAAQAQDSSITQGHWEVHYSVFPTEFLQPAVAAAYGVTRARDRALVTIAVTDRDALLAGGQPARVSGSRTNLIQRLPMEFRPVQEQNATYYISEFRFSNKERWILELEVRPDGEARSIPVRIDRQFEITP